MSNRREFFLGSPPLEFLVRHLVEDEDFLADMRRLLRIDEPDFNRLVKSLETAKGFLDRPALIRLTEEVLGSGDESRAVASCLFNAGGVLHGADRPAEEAMELLANEIETRAEAIGAPDRASLIHRLRASVVRSAGLARQWKARELVTAIGAELDEGQFICDMRPIFDQSRGSIEGIIPLTILRLNYTLPDGATAVVELRVTEKQLEDLEAKLAAAKRKLRGIKELAAKASLPIPPTKATTVEEETQNALSK